MLCAAEDLGTHMHQFQQTLSQQQTDDVVEGVVGAMELLHTIGLDCV
jgi:hypothetical protein